MRTIFLTSYTGFISRNILGSSVLKTLKEQSDLRIIVFTPPHKTEFLQKYYGSERVEFVGWNYEEIVRTKYNKFWYRLAFLLQNSRYVKDQRQEELYRDKNILRYIRYALVSGAAAILNTFRFFRPLYRFLDYYLSPRHSLQYYFEEYKPILLFATDTFGESDSLFMREARARRVTIIGMVRSWDNTTTKGILRLEPDLIIANSPTIQDELVRFHSYPSHQVTVVGLPQFDQWITGPTCGREEFFKNIGADPHKRLILFAPAGIGLSTSDWQLCEILRRALDDGTLPSDVVFLVRNHPGHPADFSRFSKDPRFIIETPGVRLKEDDYKGMELRPEENDHLRNSVYYSEMVMYIATSIGLDATVFDKPQILISFDGLEQKPYVQSVRRYNREDCLASLVAQGGTKVVNNADELISGIKEYLENPKLDQEGRSRTLKSHMYKLDGKAGERIAETILNQLS